MANLLFQTSVLSELHQHDALCVLARGLGVQHLIYELVKLYSTPKRLVFVLNLSPEHHQSMSDRLAVDGGAVPFRRINNEFPVAERQKMYLAGGCLAVTSRILTVDLLNKIIPVDLVSGVIVANAHKVNDTSAEAFILRIFRMGNRHGFIRAFSDAPDSFMRGFFKVEKVMKALFVKKLQLWPRFHLFVGESLEVNPPEVVEMHQNLTPLMQNIQDSLVEVIDACVNELKLANKSALASITTESGLTQAFDAMVRAELEPIWHKITPKSKQLVADLSTLRNCLTYLLNYDCVTFFRYLSTIRAQSRTSLWIFTEAAKRLFKLAKDRVFTVLEEKTIAAKSKLPVQTKLGSKGGLLKPGAEAAANASDATKGATLQVALEENPKWSLVAEVMAEIEAEVANARAKETDNTDDADDADDDKGHKDAPMDLTGDDDSSNSGAADNSAGKDEKKATRSASQFLGQKPAGATSKPSSKPPLAKKEPLQGRVMIVCRDERACAQLRRYLELGGPALLQTNWRAFLKSQQSRFDALTRNEANPPPVVPFAASNPAQNEVFAAMRLETALLRGEWERILAEDRARLQPSPTPLLPLNEHEGLGGLSLPGQRQQQQQSAMRDDGDPNSGAGQWQDEDELMKEADEAERADSDDDPSSSQPTLTQGSSKKGPKRKTERKASAKGKAKGKGKEQKSATKGKGTKRKQPSDSKSSSSSSSSSASGESRPKKGRVNMDAEINQLDDSAMLDADEDSKSASSSAASNAKSSGHKLAANAHHKHLDVDKLTELKFISQLHSQSQAAEKKAKSAGSKDKDKDGKDSKDSSASDSSAKGSNDKSSSSADASSSLAPVFAVIPSLQFVLHPIKGSEIMLQRFRPEFVILFDPDLSFIRQLEVFAALNPTLAVRVYFLVYGGSVEERRYLSAIQTEKDAFESLIKQKATMVVPENQDGKLPTASNSPEKAGAAAGAASGASASSSSSAAATATFMSLDPEPKPIETQLESLAPVVTAGTVAAGKADEKGSASSKGKGKDGKGRFKGVDLGADDGQGLRSETYQAYKELIEGPANNRKGGKKTDAVAGRVLVDMREFRSSLPSFLHLRGMEILPVTLEVGDYILSALICIERKSLSDLYQSFSSGRLFRQMEQLCRYYKTPILLIEFEQGKPFCLLQHEADQQIALGAEIQQRSPLSKLALMVLHFPQVRIVWSRDANMTGAVFLTLKATAASSPQDQPDTNSALVVGEKHRAASAEEQDEEKAASLTPMDILLKLPGVTTHNARAIYEHCDSLRDLCDKDLETLSEWIGSGNARRLYKFLHSDCSELFA